VIWKNSFRRNESVRARSARDAAPAPEGRAAKLSEANGTAVEVLDIDSNETTTYSSGCQVAKALNCS
jgi:hypothetical protein